MTAPIDGVCDAAFRRVEAAFRENFASRDEVGAAVSVRIEGRSVVDLWGGHTDGEGREPWRRDTLVNAYSVGKGITAMLVLSLVERGELSLDDPVSGIWPEFAVEGKSRVTLRTLLSHRAGLPGVRRPLADEAMLDWDTMSSALAGQAPYWEPDSAHGYHVNSYGFLAGEPLVRRLGIPFSRALRERLTGPLEADFHVGLATSEHGRVASMLGPHADTSGEAGRETAQRFVTGDPVQDAMLAAVYFNPAGLSGLGWVNRPEWRSAAIPSTNGHGTARAVAALYDVFLNRDPSRGGPVGPGLRQEARTIHSDGEDRVIGKPSRFGLGFQPARPDRPLGPNASAFGHFGYGGSLGFADPDSGVAFGYLMNRPGERWQTPRTQALIDAVYASLGA